MIHWRISAAAGFLLTGRYRPVCSISWDWPDCAGRTLFHRAMNRTFPAHPPQIAHHCLHTHAVWLLCCLLRR